MKTDFLSHGHRRLRRRAEPLFADRDRQERPRYRLGGTPFPGDFIDRLIAVALPLRDQRVDHQRRNLEQQDDRADQHELDGQGVADPFRQTGEAGSG